MKGLEEGNHRNARDDVLHKSISEERIKVMS